MSNLKLEWGETPFNESARDIDGCRGCPHLKYCGLSISNARLKAAGYCQIYNKKNNVN